MYLTTKHKLHGSKLKIYSNTNDDINIINGKMIIK